jgi:hypothetical protein
MHRASKQDFVCLIIGNDDAVLHVQTFENRTVNEAVLAGRSEAVIRVQCRGFQLWSGGKMVYSQLGRNGEHWSQHPPEIG